MKNLLFCALCLTVTTANATDIKNMPKTLECRTDVSLKGDPLEIEILKPLDNSDFKVKCWDNGGYLVYTFAVDTLSQLKIGNNILEASVRGSSSATRVEACPAEFDFKKIGWAIDFQAKTDFWGSPLINFRNKEIQPSLKMGRLQGQVSYPCEIKSWY